MSRSKFPSNKTQLSRRRLTFEGLEERRLLDFGPTDFAAEAVSDGRVNLSWTDNATDETGYVVERSPDGIGSWTVLADALPPDTTAYADTLELVEDTTYFYRVSAMGPTGPSDYAMASARTLLAAPGSPMLSLLPVSDSYVQGGPYADNNYGTLSVVQVKEGGTLPHLTRYGYTKFDLSGVPAGLASVQLRMFAKLTDASSTDVPLDFYPVTDTTWRESGPGGITFNTQPASGSSPIASATIADTTWTWYTVDLTDYVAAEKAAGRNVVSFLLKNRVVTTLLTMIGSREAWNKPRLVIVPTGPAAMAASSTQIVVGWTDVSAKEAGYVVERSTDNVAFTPVGATGANVTVFSDASLAEGTRYYYRVKAVGSDNASAYLAGGSTMTLPAAPSAPNLVAADARVYVTWANNSQGSQGYALERSTDGSAWYALANLDGAGSTTYVDAAVPVEGPVYYRVRAANAGGFSELSPASGILYEFPMPPEDVTFAYPSESQIDVHWTDRSGIELGFKIERSADGQTGWEEIGTTGPNVTWFSDPDRALFATYHYRVRATGPGGDSGYSAAAKADRLGVFRQKVLDTIASIEHDLSKPTPTIGIRLLTRGAYLALAADIPDAVARAETYIRAAFDKQLPDGNFGWGWSDTYNRDPNSVEFTMLPVGAIFLRYADRFSQEFKDYAHPHIQLAISAITNHYVPVYYTNIYTMKLVNLLLLGQVENDAAAWSLGASNLDAWLDELRTSGIHEYVSPDYHIVTYNNLLIGYNNTADAALRDSMKAPLDYLAAEMAANYFSGQDGGKLAGSHSRNYDFPDGVGSVDHVYYIEGLRNGLPVLSNYNEGLYTYANVLEGGYHPAAWLNALAESPERVVKQWFGTAPGQDRYTYLTGDFAIGSASRYYGKQDKQIAVDLASGKDLAQISLVLDEFDSPYGNVKTPEGTGHMKATHLRNAIAAVQEEGSLLALVNLGPQFSAQPTKTYTSVASNMVFPSTVDRLYLDGTEITSRTGTIPVGIDCVLGVREGDSVVAVRMFHVDGIGGYSPTAAIKFDGGEFAAGRLVAYHYSGPARTFAPGTTSRTGVLVVARRCTGDAEAAAFLQSVKEAPIAMESLGSQWTASVSLPDVDLAAGLDTATDAILYRRVNGVDYQPEMFTFSDGSVTRDLADEILNAPSAPVLVGSDGPDEFHTRLDARGANLDVFHNMAMDRRPTYSLTLSSLTSLAVNTLGGDDRLTVDLRGSQETTWGLSQFSRSENGTVPLQNPVPVGGLWYDGGDGRDTLVLRGTAADDLVAMTATQVLFDGSSVAYESAERFAFELGDGQDELSLSGAAVTLAHDEAISADAAVSISEGATLDLAIAPDVVPEPGTSFVVLANDGADPIAGSFAGMPDGGYVSVDGLSLCVDYQGGDGNDLVLTLPAHPLSIQSLVIDAGSDGASDDVLTADGTDPAIQAGLQHSMVTRIVLTLDGLMTSFAPGAFQLVHLGDGEPVDLSVASAVLDASTVVTITFLPGPHVYARAFDYALGDGNYRFTIDPTKVHTSDSTLTAGRADDFFRFFGDSDGDRDVDLRDLWRLVLAAADCPSGSQYKGVFDLDGDDDLDWVDYLGFALHFGRRLPA